MILRVDSIFETHNDSHSRFSSCPRYIITLFIRNENPLGQNPLITQTYPKFILNINTLMDRYVCGFEFIVDNQA